MTGTGKGWVEVGDRVFQRRYQPVDVTVTVVAGREGLMVVDTRCSLAEARELREHLREISSAPVRWVVNTHIHWDHVWGNAEFAAPRQVPPAEFWGSAEMVAETRRAKDDPEAAAFKQRLAARNEVWAAKMAELEEYVPENAVRGAHDLDLGDGRVVRMRRIGRGHTDGDLVLHVPDADVLLMGDLLEQSGDPAFGPDSFPLEWAPTLDAALALAGPDTRFVPGHGDASDASFVRAQRDAIAALADRCRSLHAAGVPVDEALKSGDWPYDPAQLEHAVKRAYLQLGQ
ncbi:MBL fold metallo-hydrolase [Streptacidiphilus pinicola]|uniref:MBL fold metallo-hydrolase n=1 Tax=Streptacidiphilus pinicola TaxID=2219663 RepID=A0A2X0IFQ0_9ACTN|nr:MBL fold metallo-hydrolase [Streptacidiphilus pinicola]RAG83882.1 MBL fold metallo-hydrolase [Streptacidiphilus pinicola]